MAPVVVIGAGMGGLTAALRLAQHGIEVLVLEARSEPGGLAGSSVIDGLRFDAGPYLLLDRGGLEWAFQRVGLELDQVASLKRVDPVYEVAVPGQQPLVFHADLGQTADGFEARWAGSGARYRSFVTRMRRIHARLQPLLFLPRPGLGSLLSTGGWRHLRFLTRSLQDVLRDARLPAPLCAALGIWTHVAGQDLAAAPSPMAFVPALIHDPGAFYPAQGIGVLVSALHAAVRLAGIPVRYGATVRRIRTTGGVVDQVEIESGEAIPARAVLSNAHGVGTYLRLLDATPPAAREQLDRLPLQSPGICVYLAAAAPDQEGSDQSDAYLRFRLPGGDALCRLLVTPAVVDPVLRREAWRPARLIMPMGHREAERLGATGQLEQAQRLIDEPWWQALVGRHRVLQVRTPAAWGTEFHLHRESMNPVMTASFMRAGRLAHRSPHVSGLHLAGSATHPGQWLSFCAISGILAAEGLARDLGC